MWRAIERPAKMVEAGGQFALAIYSKTLLDPAWKVEKRLYSNGPKILQWFARQAFVAALLASKLLRGRNPMAAISTLKARGMNFDTDIHDWLVGYPYEAPTVDEFP